MADDVAPGLRGRAPAAACAGGDDGRGDAAHLAAVHGRDDAVLSTSGDGLCGVGAGGIAGRDRGDACDAWTV